MQKLKDYLLENFEQLFVLATLLVTVVIYYLLPYKLGFLNFYFLPIILGGYYLGRRQAVLGAVLCALTVSLYAVLYPESFLESNTELDLYLTLSTWGGFLVLAGSVVGTLHERLASKVDEHRRLNVTLQHQQEDLNKANSALKEYSSNLETLNVNLQNRQEELHRANSALKERSQELEQSKRAIEGLKAKVEEALYSTMDSSVVNLIIEGRLRDEKRSVSILFSDIAGFTTYAEERPPEVVIRDLNRFIADMEPILLAYRGHIDKYMGDGIMCEFGAPLDYETYRLMGVLAAIKLQEKMSKLDYPWSMRIGIGSGTMITGLIGSKRQTYTAIGDVVNVASRLEKACTPGRLLIDRHTYDGVSHFIEARKKRDLPTKEDVNLEKERQLEQLHSKLAGTAANDAEIYAEIGHIHLSLSEPGEAFYYFERALDLDPDNKDYKVSYAESGLKMREMDKLTVKGKRLRVEAFEVVKIKDPLENRDKIPGGFHQEWGHVANLIQIPVDLVLPVEALDGCIGHSKVVAVICYAVATTLGLPEKDKTDILHAGFMADIGKEIIPHHLLNRVGTLTPSEFEMVKMHTSEGTRILRKMGYENDAMLRIVQHSHENYNGSGYPSGLKGDLIPLGSRIVAVADAYDALTSRRPYRDPWERHAALDEIQRGIGKGLYDPKIVKALMNVLG